VKQLIEGKVMIETGIKPILNISDTGVCIAVPRCAKVPNDFGPVGDRDGKTYARNERWKSGSRIGLTFLSRSHRASTISAGDKPLCQQCN
jgi:hypothetical protein